MSGRSLQEQMGGISAGADPGLIRTTLLIEGDAAAFRYDPLVRRRESHLVRPDESMLERWAD